MDIIVEDKLMYGLQVGFILLGAYLYDHHFLACVILSLSCLIYTLILYFENRMEKEVRRKLDEKLPNRETMETEDFLKAIMSDPELMDMTADVVGSGIWLHLYRKLLVVFQLMVLLVATIDL